MCFLRRRPNALGSISGAVTHARPSVQPNSACAGGALIPDAGSYTVVTSKTGTRHLLGAEDDDAAMTIRAYHDFEDHPAYHE